MSKLLYTVVRAFTFRGVKFNAGEPFDAAAVQCDNHRTHVLMNQRYIEPGYDGTEEPKTPKAEPKPVHRFTRRQKPEEPADEPDNEPENEEPEEPDTEEPENEEPDTENEEPEEVEKPEPHRRPRRRS